MLSIIMHLIFRKKFLFSHFMNDAAVFTVLAARPFASSQDYFSNLVNTNSTSYSSKSQLN